MKKSISIKTVLLVFLVSCTTAFAQFGNVTTIAGDGTGNNYGDNIAAANSSIFLPTALTIDNAGNIYFTELTNCVVRKIDVNGIITTVAGIAGSCSFSGDGGNATEAKLDFPAGIAVDNQGNLFIADRSNNRIRKIDTNGIITTVAGDGTDTVLNEPRDIAVDASGNLYITDWQNNRIRKVDTNGTISTIAGTGEYGFSGDSGAATAAKIKSPAGIALDASGNIYITTNSDRIRKIDTNGIITTIAGKDSFNDFTGDGGQATDAQFNKPTKITTASNGDIYVSDSYNHRVRRIDSNGIISTIVGTGNTGFSGGGFNGDNQVGTATQLKQPGGLAFDANGNLLIADYRNDRIRKLTKSTLSTDKFSLQNLSLYPNPISNDEKLNINSEELVSEISVYNSIGQQVLTAKPNTNSYQLDLSKISSGIYFLNIKNDKNNTGSYKIVKE